MKKNKKKNCECCGNTVLSEDALEMITTTGSAAALVLSIISICLTAVLAVAAIIAVLSKKVVYIESDN